MRNKSWDEKWVGRAVEYASWSKDPSTKVGCVIVDPHTNTEVAGGYNGFPRRVREMVDVLKSDAKNVLRPVGQELDPERWRRPTKYMFAEHAERNAIYNAARLGRATQGCWAYLSWDPSESICADCARALIQAGIHTVSGPSEAIQRRLDMEDDAGWRDSCKTGLIMMGEAQLNVRSLPIYRPKPGPQTAFFLGEL
ncbi:hypothetical protein DRQ50_00220 [bacterium]|nr:MAG: hypothetical protein DRQ50_00220 [bacterium]RKZ72451.1 MAG: hypothetical protein DRQ48_00130 [Gammaproteobacteria bacterium]